VVIGLRDSGERSEQLMNKWFWPALLLPIVILLAMSVKPVMTYLWGETIVLETSPYDPRDLFYGEYVDLRFDIERVSKKKFDPALDYDYSSDDGMPVYVSLIKQGDVYVVQRVSEQKPDSGVYIQANLMSPIMDTGDYDLEYPMERYYVEEGQGRELENIARDKGLRVSAKLFQGYAVITNVVPKP
jgi:uncharacterized membrane-anchored protein